MISKIARALIIAGIAIGLTVVIPAAPAFAKHSKHHSKHVSKKKASKGNTSLRTAQRHLANLGYYTGKIDGKTGPKTKSAIKRFQRDNGLKADGILGSRTMNALREADQGGRLGAGGKAASNIAAKAIAQDFYEKNPDFYGRYNQQYQDPMMLARNNSSMSSEMPVNPSQPIYSRFAKLEVSEAMQGDLKSYNVTVNGQPLLVANDQPAVIGISRTFGMDNEDAMIFTTYRSTNLTCPFKNYLVTVNTQESKVREIENCTRGYQASMNQGSLFIVFPETEKARAVGGTFRYEEGHLERL